MLTRQVAARTCAAASRRAVPATTCVATQPLRQCLASSVKPWAAVSSVLPSASPFGAASTSVQARSMFGQTFQVGTMEAHPRADTGTRKCSRARKAGLVPGVIYGKGPDGELAEPILVYTLMSDVMQEVARRGRTFENTQFDLKVGDEVIRVLPRQLHTHPFKPFAYRLNFLRYNPGQHPGARVDIPFKVFNEDRCPAVKDGGWVLMLKQSLQVFVKGEEIPDYLMIDLRGKRVGSKVKVSELFLNEGITLRTKQGADTNFPVAKLMGGRKGGVRDKAVKDED